MSMASHQAFPTAVQWSHVLLQSRLKSGQFVIDATAGNGHDALFLAQKVLPAGKVFIYDVQAAALQATRQRLLDHHIDLSAVVMHQVSHEHLKETAPIELKGQIAAVMFNLGYLPGGDKSLITLPESSLHAIQQALDWIAPDGLVTVVVYPGHEGGRAEADLIESFFRSLPTEYFEVQKIGFINYRSTTPFLLAARRKKSQ